MEIKFYLKRPNNRRESIIFARFNYNKVCYKYYLLDKIHPAKWNFKTQRSRTEGKHPAANDFNHRLEDVSRIIRSCFYKYQNMHFGNAPSPKSFRNILDNTFGKQNVREASDNTKLKFWCFAHDLVTRMNSGSRLHIQKNTPLARNTIASIENLLNHLRSFEKVTQCAIDFDTIDMNFYYGFVDYMTQIKKVSINTIGKLITNIKVLMREAVELGYTRNMIFTHRRFRSISVETDAIYLTQAEISELSELNFSACKRFECVRDLFLIGCFTGLRFSDLSQLSIEAISNNVLTLKQIKTGDCVHIPLKKEVKVIIEKYAGTFPAAISNQKFNQYLREICSSCELLKREVAIIKFVAGKKTLLIKPKYEFVMSHTARRSFATNEYLARDLQPAEIRAITGHKTDKSFYKYIRISPMENAANVAIKWQEREERRL